MLRTRRIHTPILLAAALILLLTTGLLQLVQSLHQRATLLESTRRQGVTAATALQTLLVTGQPGTVALLPDQVDPEAQRLAGESLASWVAAAPGLTFAALIAPDGTVYAHSSAALIGQTADELALTGIPLDRTIRRKVPNFGSVYVTRRPVELAAPFDTAAFDIVVGVSAAPVDSALRTGLAASAVVILGGLLLTIAALWAVVQVSAAGPLARIREGARRFAAGQLDERITPQGSRDVVVLAAVLNQAAHQLKQVQLTLEAAYDKLAVTSDARARDLALAAEIGRSATRLRTTDALLRETVEQIRRRFNVIYHAQVFLLDDLGDYAVLVESTGEAGRQLLAQRHKLAVGSPSVIGRVTARGRYLIASDTARGDVPWQPNPLLPHTRAEMALPLLIEGRVIGALDVQSTAPDVFTEDMVRVFSLLADQLAIAIENARLLAESADRMRAIDDLNRQLTGSAWTSFTAAGRAEEPTGYRYDRMATVPLGAADADPEGPALAAPIQVHGAVIGTLAAALPEAGTTEEDRLLVEAVAERVALAVENARLFDRTQQALAETERLYETARTVSSVAELETIFQLVAEQFSTASAVDDIDLLLSGPDPALVQYLENVYSWARPTDHAPAAHPDRLRVVPLDGAASASLPLDVPMLYGDLPGELPADHPLRPRLEQLGARSAVLAPLTASGRWFGLAVCTSRSPHAFRESFAAFASALADQLAIALENRRLFAEVQSEARRARALAEAGQLASRIGGDYAAGLHNLFQAVAGPGNYDRWWFGLLSEDRASLERVTASDDTSPDALRLTAESGALAEAARIGEIVLVNDPGDHPLLDAVPRANAGQWGKHLAVPVTIGRETVGVLLIGRAPDAPNLDERDIQLAATLASQVAIATQNRRLFDEAETQRARLQTIVDTMPTGVLVIDRTGTVLLSNEALTDLLGPDMRPGPAVPQPYPIQQAATQAAYPDQDWPLTRALLTGQPAIADDLTVVQPDGSRVTLLAQAAPIRDQQGSVIAVVGAFQDITDLQALERALQDSLRETTLLYEASRAISRTSSMDEMLQITLDQMDSVHPDQAYIVLQADISPAPTAWQIAACRPDTGLAAPAEDLFGPLLGRDPQTCDRAAATPDQAASLQALGLARLDSVPLTVRGSVTGWLVTGFTQPQALTREQRRFLDTLADQAAVTIENQRLLLRTAEALEETATLYHASRLIADAASPADILSAFVDFAAGRPVDYAALYMLLGEAQDTSYAAVELAASSGEAPGAPAVHSRFRADQFALWALTLAPDITLLDDLDQPAGNDPAHRMLAGLDLLSALTIPLHVGDRTLGSVVLGLREPWDATLTNHRVLEALADQAAISLENTQLYQQARRRARQLAISTEVSRAVTSILHLEDLLPQVVELIRDAFEYDHAQIFLLNAQGTSAELVASTGEAGRQLLAIRHSLPVGSQSVIGQVTATGQPQIALDTADARVVHRPNPLLPLTRSEMALPLIAREQIVGALDVQSNQPGAFTNEDARILQSLADMVATAIDNARLFDLAEQRADEMGVLFIVTTAAMASPDLEESLKQTVSTLRDALNVTSASIYLPDSTGQSLVKSAEVGHPGPATELSRLDIERGLVGWVARRLEAVLIDDLAQDPRRLAGSPDAGSAIAVPLQTGGSLIAVLVVESDRPHAFRQDDLRLLQTLSGSLAAIVQNNRLLREVQEANERLLEVDRLKTNFLAAMSHELRTPLNSIIGFSRVILKGIDGPLTDTQEQDITTIHDSGKHLLGLVNDILDQAKIQAGKMELSFAYFKLQDVIKGVMSSAVGLTRDKPIRLHTEIADDLPDAYGDEFRTRQILLNLISNAAKFTEEGSVTVSAFPFVEDGQTFLQLSVSDTGIGIAQKDMHLLFEAFQQIDNSLTRKVGGTGMGLPLAKSLTELQGGHMTVDSEVGVGSTFTITIPTAPQSQDGAPDFDADGSANAASVPAPARTAGVQHPRHTSVLVVEEDVKVIGLFRRYLARAGYEVFGITHADEVLNMVATQRPDIILLDVNVQQQAGWSVLETLKQFEATRTIPIMVCSLNPDRARALELGAADHVLKPCSEEQLLDALQRVAVPANRQCILLVDDQPDTVRALRDALTTTGQYDVLEARDGLQAIELLVNTARIDLVILDLRMPGTDGFDVVRALRAGEHTRDIPVLVLTADDVTAAERAALEAITIYRKDADEADLLDSVAAQLDHAKEQE